MGFNCPQVCRPTNLQVLYKLLNKYSRINSPNKIMTKFFGGVGGGGGGGGGETRWQKEKL